MEMCILDSNDITEPGCFVFDDSYLTLKFTGKKDELNTLNTLLYSTVDTRLLHQRLLAYGSIKDFLIFIDSNRDVLENPFINELKTLIQLNSHFIHLPHSGKLSFEKPLIMGVINATDDSFYDQSRILDEKKLEECVRIMIYEGVDVVDIGGESSRPGANPIDEELEIRRVVPFVKKIREFSDIPISVDTYRCVTAEKAIHAGADIINDISALKFDKEMANFAALNDVPVVLMHMKGTPSTMQRMAQYSDVVVEIKSFFSGRIAYAQQMGIKRENIILDPGIGFGKKRTDNLKILKHLDAFHTFRLPLLLGTSRKSFIGEVLNQNDPIERLSGTLATTALGVQKGVHIFRVHDVQENRHIADMVFNIEES